LISTKEGAKEILSHLGWLPIRDASVMLLTPDTKIVIMKEYAQNLIFRQYNKCTFTAKWNFCIYFLFFPRFSLFQGLPCSAFNVFFFVIRILLFSFPSLILIAAWWHSFQNFKLWILLSDFHFRVWLQLSAYYGAPYWTLLQTFSIYAQLQIYLLNFTLSILIAIFSCQIPTTYAMFYKNVSCVLIQYGQLYVPYGMVHRAPVFCKIAPRPLLAIFAEAKNGGSMRYSRLRE